MPSRNALTIRLSEEKLNLLTAISQIEGKPRQALLDEAVDTLIQQRVNDPTFREAFKKKIDDLTEILKGFL